MSSIGGESTVQANPSFPPTAIVAMKGVTRCRRARTAFAEWQLQLLELRFHQQQYLVGAPRVEFARALGLDEAQVKIWFQNRRIRYRRQRREERMRALGAAPTTQVGHNLMVTQRTAQNAST